MKIIHLLMRGAFVLLAILSFGAVQTAFADSYTVYRLTDANSQNLVGITSSGEAVISNDFGPCATGPVSICYDTYVNGVETSVSTTAPLLTYDNGAACSLPSGFTNIYSGAICNGGKTAFESFESPNGDPDGVYVGSLGNLTDVGFYAEMDGMLNSSGDFLFVDGQSEYIYEAVDTSVAAAPEPSSLLLLGSGITALAGVVRRRMK